MDTRLDKVERTRLEMLVNVRGMMERGEISGVPEAPEQVGKRERMKIVQQEDAVVGDSEQTRKKKAIESAVRHEEAADDDFFESN